MLHPAPRRLVAAAGPAQVLGLALVVRALGPALALVGRALGLALALGVEPVELALALSGRLE